MKKILAVILALVMCLAVFAGCGSNNIAAKTTDMKTLLQNTAKQLVKENDNATKNIYGFIPSEEEGYAELSVGADNLYLPVDGSFTLNSFMANIAASTSLKKGEMALKLDGSVNGVSIDLLEMLWNNDAISLASPVLLDNTFTLPTTDLTTKWNNSVWGSMYPITEEIPSLSFSEYMNVANEAKGIEKEILDLTTDFLVNANQSNEETTIVLGGADTAVTKFTMVVTKETLKTYLLALTDSVLKIYESGMYKDLMMASMQVDEADYEEAMAELKEEMAQELDYMDFEDVTFYVYGYKSKIVRVEWTGMVDDTEGTIYLQFNNPDYLLDDIDFVVISNDTTGTNKATVSVDSNLASSTGDVFMNFNIELDEYGTVTNLAKVEMNFNYSIGNYTVALGAEDFALSLTGTCKKGNMFEMTFDDIVVTNSYSTVSVQELVKAYLGSELEISVKVSPSAGDIELTNTSKTTDILTITEDDLTNMQSELMGNVMGLLSQMGISLY